jgi:peptidoglycan-associated lipoprotein
MALIATPALADAPPEVHPPSAQATAGCGLVRVHFETDSAELGAAEKAQLNDAADCLKAKQRLRITVAGNTDERGSEAYNLQLGEERAQAVANYLEERGVDRARLMTESLGKDQPLCDDSKPDCWKKNRRTTMRDACRL